jgi:hypothetical protein
MVTNHGLDIADPAVVAAVRRKSSSSQDAQRARDRELSPSSSVSNHTDKPVSGLLEPPKAL